MKKIGWLETTLYKDTSIEEDWLVMEDKEEEERKTSRNGPSLRLTRLCELLKTYANSIWHNVLLTANPAEGRY